jgi:hypothetical protein
MRLLLSVALTACATAGPSEVSGRPDGGGSHPDATGQHVDAFVNTADAPPGQQSKTLGQTTSQTLRSATSIACGNSFTTQPNNYYRVFDLASNGITTDFHVNQISFQVEDCESSAGNGQVVQAQVGKYTGTPPNTAGGKLTPGNMTVLATNSTVQVPEIDEVGGVSPGGTVNVPINATIPAGGKVFIEVDVNGGSVGSFFYMGANNAGQSALGFFSAPACTPPGATPTDISSVAAAEVDLLMTVTGTY